MENTNPIVQDGDLNLAEILSTLWKSRILILSFTILLGLFTLIVAFSLPNYYKSESLLTARDSQELSGISSYSGLASIAGIGLPAQGRDKVTEIIEVIKSRDFVKHLLTFEDVLPALMAFDGLEQGSRKLIFNDDLYDSDERKWINQSLEPSYIEVHKYYLEDVLSVTRDKQTGLVNITVEHQSPVFAQYFLSLIIKEANSKQKLKDLETASRALDYLKLELSQTKLLEIKESINQLIKAQLETTMMANVHEDYSLIAIEPPFLPEEKSKPSRLQIIFFGLFAGLFLSSLFVLLKRYLKDENTIES
tara:strand:+ start:163 stop:1080 length:918 start_codon:yes stop_codon:yes gene_type:complete